MRAATSSQSSDFTSSPQPLVNSSSPQTDTNVNISPDIPSNEPTTSSLATIHQNTLSPDHNPPTTEPSPSSVFIVNSQINLVTEDTVITSFENTKCIDIEIDIFMAQDEQNNLESTQCPSIGITVDTLSLPSDWESADNGPYHTEDDGGEDSQTDINTEFSDDEFEDENWGPEPKQDHLPHSDLEDFEPGNYDYEQDEKQRINIMNQNAAHPHPVNAKFEKVAGSLDDLNNANDEDDDTLNKQLDITNDLEPIPALSISIDALEVQTDWDEEDNSLQTNS